MAFGVCTNFLSSFPPSTGQKWKIFANHFFDIVTTYNDEICYVKHVLAPFSVVFTLFGCGGGGLPRGLGHNPLVQFSRLGSSKMEISETDFFDIMTIQNDQISYVKHVLAPVYVFFTLFGCGGGGLPRGLGHNLLMQFSRLSSSRMVVPLPSSRCLAEGNIIFQCSNSQCASHSIGHPPPISTARSWPSVPGPMFRPMGLRRSDGHPPSKVFRQFAPCRYVWQTHEHIVWP